MNAAPEDREGPLGTTPHESHADPTPSLVIGSESPAWRTRPQSPLTLEFHYGTVRVTAQAPGTTIYDSATRTTHHRKRRAEDAARSRLLALGAKGEWNSVRRAYDLFIVRTKLPAMLSTLAREGWLVRSEGITYRSPGELSASVRSGVDWFDLDGTVQYGDKMIPLATLLEARRLGHDVIDLGDGTIGLMPTEWLARLGPITAFAERVGGATRFRSSQLVLLDALLATVPSVDVDGTFERARAKLATFGTVAPLDAPPSFRAESLALVVAQLAADRKSVV